MSRCGNYTTEVYKLKWIKIKVDDQYICIQTNYSGKPWVRLDTLSYNMRDSKDKLLCGGRMSWLEARKYGWKCIKVHINLTPVSNN